MAKHRQTKVPLFGSHQTIDQLQEIMKSQSQAYNYFMTMMDEMKSTVKMLKLLHIVME